MASPEGRVRLVGMAAVLLAEVAACQVVWVVPFHVEVLVVQVRIGGIVRVPGVLAARVVIVKGMVVEAAHVDLAVQAVLRSRASEVPGAAVPLAHVVGSQDPDQNQDP